MCKVFLIIFFFCCFFSSEGQDSLTEKKINELYVSLSGSLTMNCSFKYKRQIKNSIFLKTGFVDLYARRYSNIPKISLAFPQHVTNISAGIQLGLEFRKKLNENFSFFHGPSPSITYIYTIVENENPYLPEKERRKMEKPDINWQALYTLGILYQLNDHILVIAELNPGLYVELETRETYNIISSLFKFSSNTGIFSVAYRL